MAARRRTTPTNRRWIAAPAAVTPARRTRASRPPHTGIPVAFDGLELELVLDPDPNVRRALDAMPDGECVIFDDAGGGNVWVGGIPMNDLDGIVMDGTTHWKPRPAQHD